jgi:hypothetical protein
MAKYVVREMKDKRFAKWLRGEVRCRAAVYRTSEDDKPLPTASIDEAAGALGVPSSTIRAWLDARAVPTPGAVLPIARWSGVSLDSVLLLFMPQDWAGQVVRAVVRSCTGAPFGTLGCEPVTFEAVAELVPFLSRKRLQLELVKALDAGTLKQVAPIECGTYATVEKP